MWFMGTEEVERDRRFDVCLCATAEAAGTGRARGAAEGSSALGAGAAAHTAGETAGRFGEDAQRQPRISRVL